MFYQDAVQYLVHKHALSQKGVIRMLINASAARQNFFRIIEAAVNNHQPVTVTSKQGNVVIISEADYGAIQETLYLLSVPGMRESIIEGMKAAPEECVNAGEIDW